MYEIWKVLGNTFKEIIRDRILYGLVVFSALIVLVSLVLGELSFSEQVRISINFSLAAIQISMVMMAIFIGSSLVFREIEKKTILTILVRSTTRMQFLIGKVTGLMSVMFVFFLVFSLIFLGILHGYGFDWDSSFALALWGILLESMIMLSVALFWGVILRPTLAVITTVTYFFVGHWVENLGFFAKQTQTVGLKYIHYFVQYTFPDLEKMNWRGITTSNELPEVSQVLLVSGYSIVWIILLVTMAVLFFQRRDFV